jgi:hypothetical protein
MGFWHSSAQVEFSNLANGVDTHPGNANGCLIGKRFHRCTPKTETRSRSLGCQAVESPLLQTVDHVNYFGGVDVLC